MEGLLMLNKGQEALKRKCLPVCYHTFFGICISWVLGLPYCLEMADLKSTGEKRLQIPWLLLEVNAFKIKERQSAKRETGSKVTKRGRVGGGGVDQVSRVIKWSFHNLPEKQTKWIAGKKHGLRWIKHLFLLWWKNIQQNHASRSLRKSQFPRGIWFFHISRGNKGVKSPLLWEAKNWKRFQLIQIQSVSYNRTIMMPRRYSWIQADNDSCRYSINSHTLAPVKTLVTK